MYQCKHLTPLQEKHHLCANGLVFDRRKGEISATESGQVDITFSMLLVPVIIKKIVAKQHNAINSLCGQ